MYFIIYETTNTVNGKRYRGAHATEYLADGYLGSGKQLLAAIAKYGKSAFTRNVLEFCSSERHMFEREAALVNEEWIERADTYNTKLGGFGGWNHIWNDENNRQHLLRKTPARLASSKETIKLAHDAQMKMWENGTAPEEWRVRLSKAGKLGGKVAGGLNKLSTTEVERRLGLIKDIDISKRGGLQKVAKTLGVSHTQARRFLKEHLRFA